jgi:beta-phosphoglucomutase-like phosphatase (HAD superfamily)
MSDEAARELPKFADGEQAARLISRLGREFAVVRNPAYVHPAYEVYPLAPKITEPRQRIAAVVKDMDGTTTTTEALCLHSLEHMVRRITGRMDRAAWPGLDRERDYPHIIGNSTTKHVEYLVETYAREIKPAAFRRAYLDAAAWTLAAGRDEGRRRETSGNLASLGVGDVVEDPEFRAACRRAKLPTERRERALGDLPQRYAGRLRLETFTDRVRAAVDVYYQRYHEILAAVDRGEGERLSRELLGAEGGRLIEPMPGVAVFLGMVTGLLGEDAALFYDQLREYLLDHPRCDCKPAGLDGGRERLAALGRRFEREPAKASVVTSSIEYEARIVLAEVFDVVRGQVEAWSLSEKKRAGLVERLGDYRSLYDAFITASDSSEIRLKPHRDLYSIALHALGVAPEQFDQVIGFEDSESGTIAIRAAGIGLCAAVPFAETAGHDLSAAAFVLHGGLPEAMLVHNLWLA